MFWFFLKIKITCIYYSLSRPPLATNAALEEARVLLLSSRNAKLIDVGGGSSKRGRRRRRRSGRRRETKGEAKEQKQQLRNKKNKEDKENTYMCVAFVIIKSSCKSYICFVSQTEFCITGAVYKQPEICTLTP